MLWCVRWKVLFDGQVRMLLLLFTCSMAAWYRLAVLASSSSTGVVFFIPANTCRRGSGEGIGRGKSELISVIIWLGFVRVGG